MNINHKLSILNFWHDLDLGGLSFMSAQYLKPHRFERHVHDELVITVTELGVGQAEARNLSDPVGPSSIWVSGAGEYHCGHIGNQQHWSYRAIYLDNQALQSLSDAFMDGSDCDLIIPQGLYIDQHLSSLLIKLHRKMEAGSSRLEKEALWWSAMGLFFGRYGQQPIESTKDGIEKGKMEIVRDYIAAHFREDIATEKLSELTNLSSYYLIRSFKRKYGLPPHAYANQLKLIAAKQQLIEGINPAAIASDVGFYDQSHFNKLFKKTYGITPGTYSKAFN